MGKSNGWVVKKHYKDKKRLGYYVFNEEPVASMAGSKDYLKVSIEVVCKCNCKESK